MKTTREETSPREVVLNIELESADTEPFLDRSYRRVVNRVQIPGFRRGKAPRIIVENFVGTEALVRETLDSMVQDALERAIKDENLETFGDPDVEMVEIDPVSFKAVVPLEPVIDLGDFRSLQLEPEHVEVTEEQVDKLIEQMRYDSAPWEPADRPVKFGDLVTLDVDGSIKGNKVADDKGVDFIPTQDNPRPFPGFSVYLEAMKRDESKEFTLKVPEDEADSTIAGEDCNFSVKVVEIKEKVLPELDDEFAKGVGDGYESLEALRANVLESLTEQVERAAQRAFQEKSLQEVIKGASIEVSELTTNREIDHLLEEQAHALERHQMDMDTYLRNAGKSREELREEIRPAAAEQLTQFLVVRKLAQEEDIQVTPEEVDAELENLSSVPGASGESLAQALASENARSSIASAMLTRKVLEWLAQVVQGGVEEEETSQEEDQAAPPAEQPSVETEDAEDSTLQPPGSTDEGQSN